jgi:hypothetical protein
MGRDDAAPSDALHKPTSLLIANPPKRLPNIRRNVPRLLPRYPFGAFK